MYGKQRVHVALLGILVLISLLATGVATTAAASPSAQASCDSAVPFDASSFANPTVIDNQWLPLVPGTQFTLEGRSNATDVTLPHRVVLTVTGLTKVIDGVRTVVLWDRDFDQDLLSEAELAFEAQDDAGNVWNMGEYPEEYLNGEFQGAPNTWIAGMHGARAGLGMPGHPQPGTPAYLQGLVRSIKFMDCGQVSDVGQTVSVPAGTYDGVLLINEWSPLDRDGGIQLKYYAPGVGNVQIGAVNDPEGETLVLIDHRLLDQAELALANEAALALDSHGYEVSNVYRKTPPAE